MNEQQSSKEQELLKHVDHLEFENNCLRQLLTYCMDIISSEKEKAKKQEEIQTAQENLFITETQNLYQLKNSILNKSESRNYYWINKELFSSDYADEYKETYGKLYVFPQVALHSVISLAYSNVKYDIYTNNFFRNKYLSKSIDFLICSLIVKEYSDPDGNVTHKDYLYNPILAIEIDGVFHSSESQIKRDNIKNAILAAINLPLIRYSLESPDKEAIGCIIRNALLGK